VFYLALELTSVADGWQLSYSFKHLEASPVQIEHLLLENICRKDDSKSS
jgi:hypothetical protein